DDGRQIERNGLEVRIANGDSGRRLLDHFIWMTFGEFETGNVEAVQQLLASSQHVDGDSLRAGQGAERAGTYFVDEELWANGVGPYDDTIAAADRRRYPRIRK